ncbi:unnamed protein product [Mytilus coruscus]|uniref:Uncharacterized protein n=1 Tax=Mytilus coruscus TaxID=42192 RepID=A0A6J8C4C6_MYTCO|nr:unnamed protein product [Mytilus coruscus]
MVSTLKHNIIISGYLQRRNEKWKVFADTNSAEGTTAIYYKKLFQVYIVTEDVFHEEVMASFITKQGKGLHFIATPEHGKSSYITNFLCTSLLAESYALCNKIIFYHMCSLDDITSSNSFLFIKRFSESIISLYPDAGHKIQFDQNIQQFFQEEFCLLDITLCAKSLILTPLKKVSAQLVERNYIILIDFLDDCLVLGKTMDIIQILRKLIKELPKQLKFFFISRRQRYKFTDLDILSLDSLVILRAGRHTRGVCVLGCLYIHTYVAAGPFVTAVFLLYLWYIYLKPIQPLVSSQRTLLHKDWFYKLDLRCDSIDVNCIVDRRLEKQYISLKLLYGRRQYNDYQDSKPNVKKKNGNLTDLSEFETIYTLRQRRQIRDKKLNALLLKASQKKQPFLCRWILLKLRNKDENINIEHSLDIALDNNDIHTSRVLSWCITNNFYQKHQEKLSNAVNIYPGVRCICKATESRKRVFCSKSLVIVVVLQRKVRRLPQEFRGFEIEPVRLYDLQISEGNHILKYLARKRHDSFHLKVGISNERAQTLFVNHNNLGMICPSIVRSRLFYSKRHFITDEVCVQLHCTKKGIIPIGNEHFPNTINGCPTDVIEAQPQLLSNLRIGDKVGTQTSTGTLGGFNHLLRLQGAKAYIHARQVTIECGNVIWRAFDHDDTSRTSVDAALVVLSNATIDQNDILNGSQYPRNFSDLGLSSPFLNTSCLDHEEFCISIQTADIVSAGAMTKMEINIKFPRQSDADVQFSNTGPTTASVNNNVYHPLWTYSPVHLQLPSGYLTDRRIFRMYNQIAINLPLVQGDSGTCIYIINHPGQKNGCIGMAIAFCGGLTLVTPLKDILKRINIS